METYEAILIYSGVVICIWFIWFTKWTFAVVEDTPKKPKLPRARIHKRPE